MNTLIALVIVLLNTMPLAFGITAIREGKDVRAAFFTAVFVFGCLLARHVLSREAQ